MQTEVKEKQIANDLIKDIALRRMRTRGLANLAISKSDESAATLAEDLQHRAEPKKETPLLVTEFPTHEEALRDAALNGSVAILPLEIGAEALKRHHCGRLVDIFEPETSVSLVASLENITQERQDIN